jgi:Flp pilus assembly protein TadD
MAEAQLERAIKHYSDAIRIDPTHSAAYLLRARAFEEQGDDERAEADLVKAQRLKGGDA